MRKKTKAIFILIMGIALTFSLFSNGLNLNSVGTKAATMGGAFIGLADDYSAVFWNPAGLTQMKSQNFAVYGSFIMPEATYKLPVLGIDATTKSTVYPSGAFGYFKPLSEKLVVGFLVYVPAGAGTEWDGNDLANLPGMNGRSFEWKSMVGMVSFSPTVAYKINDMVSVGATINFDYGMLDFNTPGFGQYSEELTGTGIGATFGLMIKPSDMLSIGLTYKTPVKISAEGEVTMEGAPLLGLPGLTASATGTREITWPMWFGAGIALKPMDNLTITADIQYTNWKELDEIDISFDNKWWNLLFAQAFKFHLNWDNTIQYRFGFEYLLNESIAIRGGYYYDPSPSPAETLSILLPEVTYNAFTFGVGYKSGGLTLDLGFEYLKGQEVECPMTSELGMPGYHNVNIMAPNFAISYRF